MDPEKISVKLDCGLFEAGWSPETHSKNPPINSLGKFFYKQNSKWPLLLGDSCDVSDYCDVSGVSVLRDNCAVSTAGSVRSDDIVEHVHNSGDTFSSSSLAGPSSAD